MYHDAYEIFADLDRSTSHHEPDLDSIRQLFAENPGEARKFLLGQTLLHKSMECCPRLDLVDVLLEAHPEAVDTEDEDGFLPLHRLLLSRHWYPVSPDVVEILVSLSPDTVTVPTRAGALPLHLACMQGADGAADVVRLLASRFPDACRYRDGGGRFPLDLALEVTYPSSRVVKVLVDLHPGLLSLPDETGRLPLHRVLKRSSCAAWGRGGGRKQRAHDRTVEAVVNGFEGALRLQDGDLNTPLLQACVDDNSLSQVYCLLRRWPEQVAPNRGAAIIFHSTAFNGELLYSSLASKSVKLDHIRRWLERHPDAVAVPDLNGRLPLHYAVLSESDLAYSIVLLCVTHGTPLDEGTPTPSPSSACGSNNVGPRQQLRTVDNDGRLPIHFAAASPTCGSDVLGFLIESHPEGLMQADRDGRLPWHYADCSRQDVVIEKTRELFPDMDLDLDLVPEEIRWDMVQVIHDPSY